MSVPSWLPSGDGTDLVTAYKLHALQGSVVHLNIFSLPEISLPALRIADSVRLRSVRFHRDSKGSNPCLVTLAHPLQVAPFNLCWRRCCELEPFLDQLILPLPASTMPPAMFPLLHQQRMFPMQVSIQAYNDASQNVSIKIQDGSTMS